MNNIEKGDNKYVVKNAVSLCHTAPVYSKKRGDKSNIYCYDCDAKLDEVSYIDPFDNIIMCYPDSDHMVHSAYDTDFGIDGDHDLSRDLLLYYWFDLKARIDNSNNKDSFIVLHSGERDLIFTGLKVSMPIFVDLEIRPRSGLALKQGITIVNSPGTVDFNYRNEIGVILMNLDKNREFFIRDLDRIAQAKFNFNKPGMKIPNLSILVGKSLFNNFHKVFPTSRGLGGFGSTGVN